MQAAAPSPGETLELLVDSSDQDNDGRDDVRVTVKLTAGGPAVSATLRYLDRAAGTSVDPREPAASLGSLAAKAQSLAKQKKGAKVAAELVSGARRLFASLCASSGSARVFDAQGSPLVCSNLGAFHQRLAMAECQAALAQGDPLTALSVLGRDGWYGGRIGDQERANIERSIVAAVREVTVSTVIMPAAVPEPGGSEPRYSPLAFEGSTEQLLVMTRGGLVRVVADGSREEPAGPEVGAWTLGVTLPGGARWTGFSAGCDRSEVELVFAATEPVRRATPELLAPRPMACTGPLPDAFPRPIALGTRDGELEAIVAGVHVGPKGVPAPMGSARSSNGRFLVVPSSLGVLVLGGERPELWRSPRLAAPAALTDCVVSSSGNAVGCTLMGQALLLRR
jgi:hypothetical protein